MVNVLIFCSKNSTYYFGKDVTFKLPPYFIGQETNNTDRIFFIKKIGKDLISSDYDSSIFIFQIIRQAKTARNSELSRYYYSNSKESDELLSAVKDMFEKQMYKDFIFIKKYKFSIENITCFDCNSEEIKTYYAIFNKVILVNKPYPNPLIMYSYFIPGIQNSYFVSIMCNVYDVDYFKDDISRIIDNINFKQLD